MGRPPKHTQEFKDNAVRLVIVNGMGYSRVAQQLSVSMTQLRSWVHKWKRDQQLALKSSQDSYVQELLDLREENEKLREANEILKKLRRTLRKTEISPCCTLQEQKFIKTPSKVTSIQRCALLVDFVLDLGLLFQPVFQYL